MDAIAASASTSTTLSNEQLAYIATRTFGKLWMPRGTTTKESLQPFQTFCCELLRSTQIAIPIVMLALLYVQKFKQRFPGLHGGSGSEYRMFVVSLMLSSKYLEDNTFTTQTWSEVSRLPAKDLSIMQREFLMALDHRLHVSETDYNGWITRLQTIVLDDGRVDRPASAAIMSSPTAAITPSVSVSGNKRMIYQQQYQQTPAAVIASSPDYQVVPSPSSALSQCHELPTSEYLLSPPAKRMRHSSLVSASTGSNYGVSSSSVRFPVAQQSQPLPIIASTSMAQYTPPMSSISSCSSNIGGGFVCHNNGGEFNFKIPISVAAPIVSAPVAAGFFPSASSSTNAPISSQQQQQSVLFTNIHHASALAAAAPQQQTQHTENPANVFMQHNGCHQQLTMAPPTISVAAALASHYRALYSAAAMTTRFGPGTGSLPLYTYGA